MRARIIPHPLSNTDLSKAAAAANTTLDSSKNEAIAAAAAAAFLDLDPEKNPVALPVDATILAFCQAIGISDEQAQHIACHEDAAYVHAQIASYKAVRGKKGAGWFIRAVEEGYDLRSSTPKPSHSRNKPQTSQPAPVQDTVPARRLLHNLDDL